MKKLEADLAKTEEDLLRVMKKPNQILLPTTLSKILEERSRKNKLMPIVQNIAAKVNLSIVFLYQMHVFLVYN